LPKASFELNNHLQALISIDPIRARDDPIVVKNVPYYKAKKALEVEVMKFDPPPRPQNWGVSVHCLHPMVAFFDARALFNNSFQLGENTSHLVFKTLTMTYTIL